MTTKCTGKEAIAIMAIDLSKHSFQLHGVNGRGQKLTRIAYALLSKGGNYSVSATHLA